LLLAFSALCFLELNEKLALPVSCLPHEPHYHRTRYPNCDDDVLSDLEDTVVIIGDDGTEFGSSD
jgi:hypothetical protein